METKNQKPFVNPYDPQCTHSIQTCNSDTWLCGHPSQKYCMKCTSDSSVCNLVENKSCSSCVHIKLKTTFQKPCEFSKLCVCVNGSEYVSKSEQNKAIEWAKTKTKSEG